MLTKITCITRHACRDEFQFDLRHDHHETNNTTSFFDPSRSYYPRLGMAKFLHSSSIPRRQPLMVQDQNRQQQLPSTNTGDDGDLPILPLADAIGSFHVILELMYF